MLQAESSPDHNPNAAATGSSKGIQPTQNIVLVCDSQMEEEGQEKLVGETLAPTQLQVHEEDLQDVQDVQEETRQHQPTFEDASRRENVQIDDYGVEIKRLEEELRTRWLANPVKPTVRMSQVLDQSLAGSQTSMTQIGSLTDEDVDAVRIGNELQQAMIQGSPEATLKLRVLSEIIDVVLNVLFGGDAVNIDSDRHSMWYWFLIKQLTRSTSCEPSTGILTTRNLFQDMNWSEEQENVDQGGGNDNKTAIANKTSTAPGEQEMVDKGHEENRDHVDNGKKDGEGIENGDEDGEGNGAVPDGEDLDQVGDEGLEVGGEHILSAFEVSQRQDLLQASLMIETDRLVDEQDQEHEPGCILSAAAWLIGTWGRNDFGDQEEPRGVQGHLTNVQETCETGVGLTSMLGPVGEQRSGPQSVVPETQEDCVPPTQGTSSAVPEVRVVNKTRIISQSQSHSRQSQSQSQPSMNIGAIMKAIDGVLAPLGGSQAEAELLQGPTLNAPQTIMSLPLSNRVPPVSGVTKDKTESRKSRNAAARKKLVSQMMGPARLGRQDLGRTIKPVSLLGKKSNVVTRRQSGTPPRSNIHPPDPYEFRDQPDQHAQPDQQQQQQGSTPAVNPPKTRQATKQGNITNNARLFTKPSEKTERARSGGVSRKPGVKEGDDKLARPVSTRNKNRPASEAPKKRKAEETDQIESQQQQRKSAKRTAKQNSAPKPESLAKTGCARCRYSSKGCNRCREPKAQNVDVFQGINFLVSMSESKGRRISTNSMTEAGEEVKKMIEKAKGVVVDKVPPPIPPPSPNRRRSLNRCHADPVHALVTQAASRRPKYIYAALNGLPIVTPQWIKQCIAEGRLLPWNTADISPPSSPKPETGFEGLVVQLVSSSNGADAEFQKFIKHAGAAEVKVGKALTSGSHTCDLIVIDDDLPDRTAVERSARAAQVASIQKSKALDIMMRKTSPTSLSKAIELAKNKRMARGDESAVHHATPPLPPPSLPRPVPPPAPLPLQPPPPPPAAFSLPLSPPYSPDAELAHDKGKGKRDVSTLSLTMEGPLDNPPSDHLPAKFARKYYDTMVLHGTKIPMGSFVELKSTDSEVSRVAKLEALWVETSIGGDRHFGKFLRFYRPGETAYAFPFRTDLNFVFQSSVKEQLPLSRVERRCKVSYLPDSNAAGPSSEPFSYVCMYHYDEETETLTTLPK